MGTAVDVVLGDVTVAMGRFSASAMLHSGARAGSLLSRFSTFLASTFSSMGPAPPGREGASVTTGEGCMERGGVRRERFL